MREHVQTSTILIGFSLKNILTFEVDKFIIISCSVLNTPNIIYLESTMKKTTQKKQLKISKISKSEVNVKSGCSKMGTNWCGNGHRNG